MFVFSRAIGAHHRNRPRSGLLGIDWHAPQAAGARERRAHWREISPYSSRPALALRLAAGDFYFSMRKNHDDR